MDVAKLIEQIEALADHLDPAAEYAEEAAMLREAATALETLQRERDAWRKAAVEAVIPLEALNAAGRGVLSEAAWTEVQNGIREVRETLEAYPPARTLTQGD